MHQCQDSGQPPSGVERNRDLVPFLQGLSRRLDMNTTGNIGEVRRELQRLLGEGRISPPPAPSSPYEQLSFAGPMRSIADGARLSSHEQPREKNAPEPQADTALSRIEAMSPPELNCYISAQLLFHSSFDQHLSSMRPPKHSRRPPHGSDR